MISKSNYRIYKLYNEKRFYKKQLLELYEKFKSVDMDKELIPICDFINYNCDNINTVFSCSGHYNESQEKRKNSGYISLKYRNVEDIAYIITLIPFEFIDMFHLERSRNRFVIYFKSKDFDRFIKILFEIFEKYNSIMTRDSVLFYDTTNDMVNYEIHILDWYTENDKKDVLNGIKRREKKNGEIK